MIIDFQLRGKNTSVRIPSCFNQERKVLAPLCELPARPMDTHVMTVATKWLPPNPYKNRVGRGDARSNNIQCVSEVALYFASSPCPFS